MDATTNLAILCSEHGNVVKARLLYEEAHNKGDVGATFGFGLLCNEQGDVVSARLLFEETHSKGHVDATPRSTSESCASNTATW